MSKRSLGVSLAVFSLTLAIGLGASLVVAQTNTNTNNANTNTSTTPAVSLTVSPTQIYQGESATLTLSSASVKSCTGSSSPAGWSASATGGKWTLTPSGSTVYTATCLTTTGSTLTRSAAVTVNVVFIRGDTNRDGKFDFNDLYPYGIALDHRVGTNPDGTPKIEKGNLGTLACLDAADFNDDGQVNANDIGPMVNAIVNNISNKISPPAPGKDATVDSLTCLK